VGSMPSVFAYQFVTFHHQTIKFVRLGAIHVRIIQRGRQSCHRSRSTVTCVIWNVQEKLGPCLIYRTRPPLPLRQCSDLSAGPGRADCPACARPLLAGGP
jgi:hypothetical protein